MKHLKLIAVAVGLILVVNATAGAITFSEPWMGPIVLHVSSRDSGTSYFGNLPGIYIPPPPGVPGPGAFPAEDSWGIFKVDTIQKGMVMGPNNIVAITGILWTDGTDNQELVGIFWGEQDIAVQITGLGTQSIEGVGMQMAVWQQNYQVYNDGLPGSPARSAVNPALYNTVGTDASSSLYLTGTSTPGFLGTMLPGVTEFQGIYDPTVPINSVAGSAHMFVSVGPVDVDGDLNPNETGSDNQYWDGNFFTGAGGITADLSVQMTTWLNNPSNTPAGQIIPPGPWPNVGGVQPPFDWTVHNSDPITTYIVPEPITMLGLFLGVGSLAGYIRKRRQA